ncbi:cupin domain-containing protein [Actinomadura alba]|uniref:Cupin domain-containing protein n=1 Tax=Actinomadura alba TaxID=406431 RepID=A0ABR7LU39_9ACTN|nr:cupin domain-containing protein [Actinomadura alba]MBC6468198.1 cupin domain-containing protein [Actinomadura alba]
MPVIRTAEGRSTETPNAVMTTLASPTLGGTGQSLWRVDMRPGAQGPLHVFDTEQIWSVVGGAATVELDGETFGVGPGDTVVMPPAVQRQITADPLAGFAAVVTAAGNARAGLPDGTDRGVPPWIA